MDVIQFFGHVCPITSFIDFRLQSPGSAVESQAEKNPYSKSEFKRVVAYGLRADINPLKSLNEAGLSTAMKKVSCLIDIC